MSDAISSSKSVSESVSKIAFNRTLHKAWILNAFSNSFALLFTTFSSVVVVAALASSSRKSLSSN